MSGPFKIVGIDDDSLFPERVEERLTEEFASNLALASAILGLDSRFIGVASWNGTAYVIPNPRPEKLIFLGPIDPGLLMTANDLWSRPGLATVADIVASANNPASPLYAAIRNNAAGKYVPMQIDTYDGSQITRVILNSGTNNEVLAYKVPKASGVPSVFARAVVPEGWNSAQPAIHWLCADGTAGNVRFRVRSIAVAGGLADGVLWESSQPSGTLNTVVTTLVPDVAPSIAGKDYSCRIGRNGTSGTDTFSSDVYILGADLVRLS